MISTTTPYGKSEICCWPDSSSARPTRPASELFRALLTKASRSRPRTAGPEERFWGIAPNLLAGVSPTHLRDAAIRALAPKPDPKVDINHVAPIGASVTDAVAELMRDLPTVGRCSFRALTAGVVERLQVIVRFLAVLELFKDGLVELEQLSSFGEIEVVWIGSEHDPSARVSVDAYDG